MSTPKLSIERVRVDLDARNARHAWSERESLLVEFHHEGLIGRGEAAPLAGYSRESFDAVQHALEALSADDVLAEPGERLPPSAEFAVHSAINEWRAQWESRALCTPGERTLATLGDDPKHAAFKRKIGRDLAAELRTVRTLRDAHPKHSIRLDANGTLSVAQTRANESALLALDVSLLEEAVSFDALSSLAGFSIPLALDESLMHPDGEERARRALGEGWVGTLVLKPSALGPSRCRRLAKIAEEFSADVIVSHLFETALGHAAACALALELGSSAPQGLGRHALIDAGPYESTLGGHGRLVAFAGSQYPVQRRT